jgi:hypothetical protein
MDASVITNAPTPLRTDTVTLEMGLEEFALLFHLYMNHVGGCSQLRVGFAAGIKTALQALPVEDRQLVELANDAAHSGGWNTELIHNYFKRNDRL